MLHRPIVEPIPKWSVNKWCFENGFGDSAVKHGCCVDAINDLRSNYKNPVTVTKVCTTTEGVQQCNIMYPAPTPTHVHQIEESVHDCSQRKLHLRRTPLSCDDLPPRKRASCNRDVAYNAQQAAQSHKGA